MLRDYRICKIDFKMLLKIFARIKIFDVKSDSKLSHMAFHSYISIKSEFNLKCKHAQLEQGKQLIQMSFIS